MQIVRAIALMTFAMVLMSISDSLLKIVSQSAPIGQVIAMNSYGGVLLFIIAAHFMGVSVFRRDALSPMMLLRNLCELTGAVGMVVALTYVPLSIFGAIIQTGPLIVTVGAALFLGETIGWRRWVAVTIGFIGMLIVMRPFGESFTGYELFAVMGIAGLSGRDLVTRAASQNIPSIALATWGFAAAGLPGLIMWAFSSRPTATELDVLWVAFWGILLCAIGYFALTSAMRMAPISIIAPFRYSRLVFTAAIAMVFFGETLDAWTYVGSAIILGAGLYTFMRERDLAR